MASAYQATLVAKNATKTIPIIMVAVANPVRISLIASLVRPGGNITGLALLAGTEIIGKHLGCSRRLSPTSPGWPSSRIRPIQCTYSD